MCVFQRAPANVAHHHSVPVCLVQVYSVQKKTKSKHLGKNTIAMEETTDQKPKTTKAKKKLKCFGKNK